MEDLLYHTMLTIILNHLHSFLSEKQNFRKAKSIFFPHNNPTLQSAFACAVYHY